MAYKKVSSIYRKQPGPKIALLPGDSVRAQMRRHLRTQRLAMADVFPVAWGIHKHSAYRIMYRVELPMSVEYVRAFCKFMGLEEEDRKRMMTAGAREAGWEI